MNRVRDIVGCEEEECRKYTGRRVGVAILDTGIFIHEDIKDRVTAFCDVVNGEEMPYDDNGHGTHISGIIGGSGSASSGQYRGIAPGCSFIGVKILDRKGNGVVGNLVSGVEWVLQNRYRYDIAVVNISIGMFPKVGSRDRNTIIESAERLWDAGLVVVAAAGNNGPGPGTITYPGISRKVITVGTIQEKSVQRSYSGRGPTPFCIMKPEVIAPGLHIMSCKNAPAGYVPKSGTSMATPVVSGAICCLLEKYPYLSPVEVKMKIHDTARDLGLAKNVQGWGQLWMPELLK
ncbi:MAG: S8 family peptidase [Lachnospiraceae bacterium]|nr:S8 family peptidase [Lachnospiraceae bacterium]